jgi:signal recognition particle subunit SRP54
MFETLTTNLTNTVRSLLGRGRLTEENIKETLSEVKTALLNADVSLSVVETFLQDVQNKAIGQEVMQSLRPGETLIKIVYDELVKIMGEQCATLDLKTTPPAVVLMVGLQGSGKTTTAAKLASWLEKTQNKSVLLASADIYRPAAMDQLEILAEQIGVPYFSTSLADPIAITEAAINQAKKQFKDVVVIDTAGRLHIDEEMMDEVSKVVRVSNPIEVLLVVDSMMGQDAANLAKSFNAKIPLTGVILTKIDGDARGGAALSMRMITNKPIKFVGGGEKLDALEPFYPERIASRILGMGDVLTLIEETQAKIDHKKNQKLVEKIQKGRAFDLEDFRGQLQQLKKMGGIQNIMNKLPSIGNMVPAKNVDNKMFIKMESIINSMTMRERRFPALIKGSNKQRISRGSGTDVQAVNQVLRQFDQVQRTMKKLKGSKMMQKLKDISF